jgi:hypothetical protein
MDERKKMDDMKRRREKNELKWTEGALGGSYIAIFFRRPYWRTIK